MSIDGNFEDLVRSICHHMGVTEKEFMDSWRVGVRELWSASEIKRHVHDSRFVLVENTNPRSKTRFPKVKRWECAICKGLFAKAQTELDHVYGENKCTNFSHAEEFLHSIALPRSPEYLQILCKDCHGIKTYSERYKVSFEEAKVRKELVQLRKSDTAMIQRLKGLGVTEIPKTKIAKERLLTELLLAQIGE